MLDASSGIDNNSNGSKEDGGHSMILPLVAPIVANNDDKNHQHK